MGMKKYKKVSASNLVGPRVIEAHAGGHCSNGPTWLVAKAGV
jgi:hypothetical protein